MLKLKQPLLNRLLKAKSNDSGESAAQSDDSATTVPSQTSVLVEEKATPPKPAEDDAQCSSARQSFLSKHLTPSKVAAIAGAIAALGGLAAVRLSPSLQASITQRQPAQIPLSQPGDPTAAPINLSASSNLYLTNQLFLRKLEAITGQPIRPANVQPVPAASPAAQVSPAGLEGAASTPTTGTTAESSAPTQENVTAAAPPAPAAEAVEFTGTTIDSVLEMRVALARDVSAIGFATSKGGLITDLDGNVLKSLNAEEASLAEIANGISVDGEQMPLAFWVYPEDGGYVAIGDSWYRGRMLIALRDDGLIAVNYVLLGDYLYSVVGSEMSASWSIEALKAQAVAARSYALTHNIRPASESYFDLDNTQRFQAYKGIGREADTTQAAVQATAGEFISYEGGIVESLYAASQAIVDDAHRGMGMSQLGAKDLAEQGYSYQEILVHYYPDTALGRIETDAE